LIEVAAALAAVGRTDRARQVAADATCSAGWLDVLGVILALDPATADVVVDMVRSQG
jgi:hypothetical protein